MESADVWETVIDVELEPDLTIELRDADYVLVDDDEATIFYDPQSEPPPPSLSLSSASDEDEGAVDWDAQPTRAVSANELLVLAARSRGSIGLDLSAPLMREPAPRELVTFTAGPARRGG